jgi:hypothetical protein
MKLEDKSTKELLALHNQIAHAPAGPKTFATRAKLVARIESIAAAKNIDLAAHLSGTAASGPPEQSAAVAEPAADSKPPKKRGLGIGELARMLIMDPAGYPHSLIATMVNQQIPGATATGKSVRWYASKMRKDGVEVPARTKHFPAQMDEEESKIWLKTITVVHSPE